MNCQLKSNFYQPELVEGGFRISLFNPYLLRQAQHDKAFIN